MADYLPRVDSLWSTTTWITAFSNLTAFAGVPPMSADDVYADGKTITIDTNINVASLRTTTAPRTGGVGGGLFFANSGVNIFGNIVSGTTTCLTFLSASPFSFFLSAGSITSSSTSNAVNNNSTGTANIRGNLITGGAYVILNNSTGTVNITGNVPNGFGLNNNGLFNFFGNISGSNSSSTGYGILDGGSVSPTSRTQFISGNIESRTAIALEITRNFASGQYIIYGNVTSGTTDSVPAIRGNGVGGNAITIFGNVDCRSTGSLRHGIFMNGTSMSNLTIYGNLSTGGGRIYNCNQQGGASFTANIFGNIHTRNNATVFLYDQAGGGTCTIYLSGNLNADSGTLFGGTVGTLAANNIDVIGNVTAGVDSNAINAGQTNGYVRVMGNVTGGTAAVAGISNTSTMRVDVSGSALGRTGVAVSNAGAGLVYIKRVVGAPGGPTNPTGGTAAGLSNSQNGLAYVEEIEFGAQGATPVSGPVFLVNRPNTVLVMEGPPPTFTPTTLFGNLNVPNLFPSVSSVRSGIAFGNGDFTGTMVVPPREAVQIGVPVDSTTGTFVLSPESFWTFKRSNSAINDPTTIGYRIKNLATIPSVGSLIGSFNVATISGYSI
jgi:hypothetical protein